MQLFGKNINVKDYDCSYNSNEFEKKILPLNLYIQAQDCCNAKCDFCNPGCINHTFNYEKLDEALTELSSMNALARTSITGGEPLLDIERVLKIIEILKKHNCRIGLNTNAYDIKRLMTVYDLVDDIYISRHHYDNSINNSIMQLETPSIDELSAIDIDRKITLHCVLQKGYIDDADKVKQYLEYVGDTNIRKVKFISLYPLTEQAVEKMIDVNSIVQEFDKSTNAGILYDKHFCCCIDFAYITSKGKFVNAILRNNKTNHFDCCKQLVYNGTNLYDGFEKKTKLL